MKRKLAELHINIMMWNRIRADKMKFAPLLVLVLSGNSWGRTSLNLQAPTDGTDATAAINSAIDATSAAGGGLVHLPAGTYTIQGHNLPSDGAVVLKSNVCLEGDGPGATILQLKDHMGADVTGLVRTPTAISVHDVCLRNLTIDGNKANNGASSVIGFFSGVNPSVAVNSISVSGNTATVTTAAEINRHSAGHTFHIFSAAPSALTGDFVVQSVPNSTTFTIAVASGTNSETVLPGQMWFYPTSLADAYIYDVLIDNVEVRNCSDYGFDPHERMVRLSITNSTSHDNDKDGFVADYIEHGAYINDHAYNNGRHGFNITTRTNNFSLLNCVADHNGVDGAVIQRGTSSLPFPELVDITGGAFHQNSRDGILVQMGGRVTISRVKALENGWAGIHLMGTRYSTVVGNLVSGNSQQKDNAKDEILLQMYDDTAGVSGVNYPSIHNLIVNNCIGSALTNRAKYSIEEANDTSDYNAILDNTAFGAATGNYLTHGVNTIVSGFATERGARRCPEMSIALGFQRP